MAARIHPVIKASLLAPLAVVPVGLLVGLVMFGLNPGVSGDFVRDLATGGAYYMTVSLLSAYAVMLVFGLPFYFIARWLGWVNYPAAILSAMVACSILAMAGGDMNSFSKIYGFLLLNAIPIACLFVKLVNPARPSDARKAPRPS